METYADDGDIFDVRWSHVVCFKLLEVDRVRSDVEVMKGCKACLMKRRDWKERQLVQSIPDLIYVSSTTCMYLLPLCLSKVPQSGFGEDGQRRPIAETPSGLRANAVDARSASFGQVAPEPRCHGESRTMPVQKSRMSELDMTAVPTWISEIQYVDARGSPIPKTSAASRELARRLE